MADDITPVEGMAEEQAEPATEATPEVAAPAQEQPVGEMVNLVSQFTAEEQKKIADRCLRDFDADVRSRSEHMRRLKRWYGLYASVMKAKSFPFNNAANVNLPTLAYPVLQTCGRVWDMMYPANGHIVYSLPTGPDDYDRAHATEVFSNWYLRAKMPEWGGGLRDTVFQTVLFGSAFRRTYWDDSEKRIRSDWIPIDDFVVSYHRRSQDPNLRDVPRYTLVDWLSFYDIEERGLAGQYENTDKVKAGDQTQSAAASKEVRQVADKIDGQSEAHDQLEEDKPRMVLEQHRVWRMPDLGAYPFDGRSHPVMITIDEASRQVLRFVLREQDEPSDLSRYLRQTEELKAYLAQMEQFQAAQQQTQVAQMQAMAGGPEMGAMMPPAPPEPQQPPPMPPPWFKGKAPEPPRKTETTFFTHYKLFSGEGFYGIGFGDLLGPLADAINTITNQYLNTLALKNARPGFISRTAKMQRGAITINPGELIEVDDLNGDINKILKFLEIPDGDRATVPLIQMFSGMAKELAGISNMMSGEGVGANRTAKEAMILAEQSLKQLSVAQRGLAESLKCEIIQIWQRFSVFLSDDEIQDVVTVEGVPVQLKIGRDMFLSDSNIVPACDPRTKIEKMEQSQQLFGFVMSNPMLAQNPNVLKNATEAVLRSLDASHLIPMLQPPPQPQGPPPPRPHYEEDADFLREKDSQPNPQDDDDEHIEGHMAFLASPPAQLMTKNGRDMADRHVRFHAAQRLNKVGAQVQGATNGQGMAGPPGGGPGPMAGPPGNAMPAGLPAPARA